MDLALEEMDGKRDGDGGGGRGEVVEVLVGSGVRYPVVYIGNAVSALIGLTLMSDQPSLISKVLAPLCPCVRVSVCPCVCVCVCV